MALFLIQCKVRSMLFKTFNDEQWSLLVMMMETVSVKCMSTQWKVFGRSYVPGYVRIKRSLKQSYRCV